MEGDYVLQKNEQQFFRNWGYSVGLGSSAYRLFRFLARDKNIAM